MTNYNKRLDEIINNLSGKYSGSIASAILAGGNPEEAIFMMNKYGKEAKQAILDWHNKQVDELLDKFEQDCKLNYTTWGNSERMLQVSGVLKRIEAERNKLKESK